MNRLLKYLILIIVASAAVGCGDDDLPITKDNKDDNWEYVVEGVFNEEMKSIMRDNQTCEINFENLPENNSDILGIWEDSLTWALEKRCWYGLEYYEQTINAKFHPSGKFEWYQNSPGNKVELIGWYEINNNNDSTILVLMTNSQGDTVNNSNEGDTVLMSHYLVYTSTQNKIRLRSYDWENKRWGYEIEELKKIK